MNQINVNDEYIYYIKYIINFFKRIYIYYRKYFEFKIFFEILFVNILININYIYDIIQNMLNMQRNVIYLLFLKYLNNENNDNI